MRCIGIDLGTTHSLIAVYENGTPRLIENSLGEVLTPSVVSVAKDGQLLVGAPARERLISHPKSSAHAFKRMMGTEKKFKLGKNNFRAEELASLILKSLKQDAEQELNETISDVVISVPAYFNDLQRNATKTAAELAGLNVQRLVNEPTAASLFYGLQDQQAEKHFLVLDLGGGTFDVTILELFEGVFEVHASAGDNQLGGEDFTQAIANWLQQQPECQKAKLTEAQAYVVAEKLKRQLSEDDSVTMPLAKEQNISLTSDLLETIISSLMSRIRQPILTAIKDANLTPSDFDEIILVGGATRMPLFKRFITRLFGRFPESRENPDTVVALGAAVQAGLLQRGIGLDEIVLTDVMPYSLGIAINNKTQPDRSYFSPIIERNQTIPISRVEEFSSIDKSQRKVAIQVYQGESRYVENNLLLDEFDVKLPNKNQIQYFDVRFTYDTNGILEVNMQLDGDDELKIDRVIQQRQNRMSESEIKAALSKLADLKIHPRDQDKNQVLFERAERLFEQSLSAEREYIGQIIDYFEVELASQDENKINVARDEVTSKLDELEQGAWF